MVTVPSASGPDQFLTSITTGAWIATSTPFFSLGWTTGATSTGSAGINISSGCFAINGTCITSGSTGGTGNVATSSSETANDIPYWTSTAGTPATLSGGSSLFQWLNPGLLVIASTTIGAGGTNGLTIFGNSTTSANAKILGTLNVTGTTNLTTINAAVFQSNGGQGADITTAGVNVFNNGLFGFSSTANSAGTADTNISRLSAGVIAFGTGAQGSAAGGFLAASSTILGNFTATGFINTSGTTGGYQIDGNLILQASSTNAETAVGQSALANYFTVTSTAGETALGYQALGNATSSVSDTAIGYQALKGSATVSSTGANTAVGYKALSVNSSGANNTAVGNLALSTNTTGFDDTAIGWRELQNNISGLQNTTVGMSNMNLATTSSDNTIMGYAAGSNISGATGPAGSGNTIFGWNSGFGITTGSKNVLFGPASIAASQNQITTGSNNISIGNDVAVPLATGSNQLNIGNEIYGTSLSGTGLTQSNGAIGIGTSTPWGILAIAAPVSGNQNPLFDVASSTPTGTTTAFIITASNNVGIGTTTPGSLLSLNGIANFTTATSTFYGNGLNLTAGCYAINGNCIGGSGSSGTVTSVTAATPNSTLTLGGTNPVTTSGTINFDLNLTHANAWTGLQTFNNSTSTLFSCTTCYIGGTNLVGGSSGTITIPNTTGTLDVGSGQSNQVMVWSGLNITQGFTNFTFSNNGLLTFPNASSTVFTNFGTAYFGGTATTTIYSNGDIGIASTTNMLLGIGNVAGFGLTPSATSTIWSSLVIATTSPNAFIITDAYGTPDFTFSTASSTNNQPEFVIAATSSANTLFQVDQYGGIMASSTGATPTIACTPSGGTMNVNSNNEAGSFTTGTASTACTITYSQAKTSTPYNVFLSQSGTSGLLGVTDNTTSFTISVGTAVTGDTIGYSTQYY